MSTEYRLSPETVILSTSDLQGNIVSFNRAFLEASGYSEDELLGQPHSILRHPDMPKEAFDDLWRVIQSGRAWSGVVKNKRKSGEFYWVMANVSPIYTDNQVSGYVSIRYPATPHQKSLAAGMYTQVNAKIEKMVWTAKPPFVDTILMVGLIIGVIGMSLPFLFPQTHLWNDWVMLLGLGISVVRARYLSRPNEHHLHAIHGLASGDFRDPIQGHDAWIDALNVLRIRIGQNASDVYDAMQESIRLNTAMQIASTNIMVADAEFNIISMNQSLSDMFKRNEAKIKRYLPHFQADRIVGANMDIFHRNPDHQRALLSKVNKDMWNGVIQLEDLTFEMKVMPILKDRYKIGYVVEWRDVTEEFYIQQQLQHAIDDARHGRLSVRIDTDGHVGFYLKVGEGVNKLLDGLHDFLSKTIFNLGQLAFNKIDGSIKGNYAGSFMMTQSAINIALRNFNEIIAQMQYSAVNVDRAMQQLSSDVSHFSSQVQQQSGAIQQTTHATHEMLSQIEKNQQHITHANRISIKMKEDIVTGSRIMSDAISAMQLVQTSGNEISNIIKLIDDIAFQTNLLALNAAVEAAKAGDHGRGFAVVAGEVRSLAVKSANAAQHIKSLIDESVVQISQSTQLAKSAGNAIALVNESVVEVGDLIGQVASTQHEQSSAMEAMSSAMQAMQEVTQSGVVLVDQTNANAQDIAQHTQKLKQLASQFQLSMDAQKISRRGRSKLADMKQAHLNWLLRIANIMSGYEKNVNVEDVGNPHICGLGKWRNGEGKRYEHLPMMAVLDRAHAHFHQVVARAVSAALARDYVTVDSLMPEISQLSRQIVGYLTQLEQQMMRNPDSEFMQKVAAAKENLRQTLMSSEAEAESDDQVEMHSGEPSSESEPYSDAGSPKV